MAQHERMVRLKHMLDTGRSFSKVYLLAQLEISFATLKRDIAYLQDRMNCPVFYDRCTAGYRLDPARQAIGTRYEFPGLWFTAEEIHALLTMQHLLLNLDAGGLLGPHIEPLRERLNQLLIELGKHNGEELTRRIRVQTVGARPLHLPHFQTLGAALINRQRLGIRYHARTTDKASEREVSPQRLIHYRGNWYLDAWCHLREGLRSFSVDAIDHVQVVHAPALDVPEAELDATLGSGYGIFSGKQVQWAELRFTPERARWVASEMWHPQQTGRFEPDGSYVLRLPYADPRELVMDVMRHVPEVEVLGPAGLRQEVGQRLRAGYEKFSGGLMW
jgi:predicted DNA-binding transcriptional regulator YafY